jgi:hypothetical protein
VGEIQPADPKKFHKEPGYSPYAGRRYPDRAYFGDEHVHTAWSGDAGMGGTAVGPEDALRFARGEQVTSTSGQPTRLGRPLDWVAITDHSDGMGTIDLIRQGEPEMMSDATLKRWHDLLVKGGEGASTAMMELVAAQSNKKLPPLCHGSQVREEHLEEGHGPHGEVQRAGALHRVHRLRVDLERGRRRQPAPWFRSSRA